MQVKLTAVIPVYGPTYAEREQSLKSILNSSNQVRMVVVADTFEKSQKESLISLLKNKPVDSVDLIEGVYGNPGSARNAGLELVNTDWICFWDSDDFPDVSKYLEMVEIADNKGYLIAKGGYKIFKPQVNVSNHVIEPRISNQNFARHIMDPGIWRYVFSRNVFGELRFPPLAMGEDQDFLVEVLLKKKDIYIFGEPVYTYTVGGGTQLTRNPSSLKDVSKSLDYLEVLLKNSQVNSSSAETILTSYIKQALTGWRTIDLQHFVPYSAKVGKVLLRSLLAGKLLKPLYTNLTEKIRNK